MSSAISVEAFCLSPEIRISQGLQKALLGIRLRIGFRDLSTHLYDRPHVRHRIETRAIWKMLKHPVVKAGDIFEESVLLMRFDVNMTSFVDVAGKSIGVVPPRL